MPTAGEALKAGARGGAGFAPGVSALASWTWTVGRLAQLSRRDCVQPRQACFPDLPKLGCPSCPFAAADLRRPRVRRLGREVGGARQRRDRGLAASAFSFPPGLRREALSSREPALTVYWVALCFCGEALTSPIRIGALRPAGISGRSLNFCDFFLLVWSVEYVGIYVCL